MLGRYSISEVPPLDAALCFFVGIGALAYAFFGRHFYWAKGLYGGSSGKPTPRWFGRLMFGSIGLLFFAVGAYNLLLR